MSVIKLERGNWGDGERGSWGLGGRGLGELGERGRGRSERQKDNE